MHAFIPKFVHSQENAKQTRAGNITQLPSPPPTKSFVVDPQNPSSLVPLPIENLGISSSTTPIDDSDLPIAITKHKRSCTHDQVMFFHLTISLPHFVHLLKLVFHFRT
ncbi:hypothetical protein ACOSP7_010380 [Xanthoceras sorbifolium]